jgi:DNA-binding NtrC family response regulator
VSEQTFRILIVDDEPNIRAGLARALGSDGLEVATAGNADEAVTLLTSTHYPLVITDLKMPGARSGLDLIRLIKSDRPDTLILIITAYGSIETAVEAMRLGAHDYIVKPVDLGLLRLQVRKALEHHQLRQENRLLRARLADAGALPEIVGQSIAVREVFTKIRQVAGTDVTVLIQGESGTGKELIARAIHNLSPRQGGPFVAANIGAVAEGLVESELFGHEKGAFSGAHRRRPGWFELAEGGTLFLDEVGDMGAKTQVDLLRVLEQKEVRRLGGDQAIRLDVRLIAATHQDVEDLVARGRLREDLYYRLNVVPLRVPPLRERRDDIPLLAQHFLRGAEQRHGREPKQISGGAMRTMCEYSWPGNVRQLRNLMERLVVTVERPTIQLDDLPREMYQLPRTPRDLCWPADIRAEDSARRPVITLDAAVQEAEKAAILAALDTCNHHRERTAQALGISVRTLHYKMNRYSLQ